MSICRYKKYRGIQRYKEYIGNQRYKRYKGIRRYKRYKGIRRYKHSGVQDHSHCKVFRSIESQSLYI